MNNRFKFRVWDKIKKRFYNGTNLNLNDYEEVYSDPAGIFFTALHFLQKDENQYIIQQYTGLNDKNGKEVFEGDILDFTARYKQTGPVQVIYYGGSYGCNIINESSGSKEFWLLNHIVQQYYPKVIGNINQLPCKPDHNNECLYCDCWLSDCPLIKK